MLRTSTTTQAFTLTLTMAFAVTTLTLLGCENEDRITPEEAAEFAERWAPTLEPTLLERTEGASVALELEKVITAAAQSEQAKLQRNEPPYGVFVQELYKEYEFKPQLVHGGKLTPSGAAIWAEVQHVADHVLDPAPYALAEIEQLIVQLDERTAGSSSDDLAATAEDKQWVINWVTSQSRLDFDPVSDDAFDATTAALLASSAADRLDGAIKAHEEEGARLAKDTAQLESRLAHDWLMFSRNVGNRHVRHQFIHPRNDDYYNDPEIRKTKERTLEARAEYVAGVRWRVASAIAESMRNETELLHRRIKESFVDVIEAEDPAQAARSVWPSQPQYAKLLTAHKQYKSIVDAGGWKDVAEKARLKVGSNDAIVKQLKERLKVEGYFEGTIDTKYDADLKKAVTLYQETHQMEASGEPHRTFWRSLNVPAERRLAQIALNIERWRFTNTDHSTDETYAYINIPDFTIELWDKGQREMRFGIVVGNNDWVEDKETGEKERGNRTPFPLAAYIDRAIYNPYWNVTPRVRTNEILPEVKKSVTASYKRKIQRNSEQQEHYDALRRALQGGGSETGAVGGDERTFASTTAQPGQQTPSAPAKPDNPHVLTAADRAAFAAKPEDFPYYNVETGEIDVSTTIPGNVPSWYAEHNYEVMYPSKSWEYVRMTPGTHNALGLVKVIFPNYADVYLHDTNAKALFARDIRAFSHGCLRMHKPLEFAEYLLRRDSLYDKHDIDDVLKEGTYMPVFLKRQVPVFIEYHTVRVDDDGRANFLADIYDMDANGVVVPKDTVHKPVSL